MRELQYTILFFVFLLINWNSSLFFFQISSQSRKAMYSPVALLIARFYTPQTKCLSDLKIFILSLLKFLTISILLSVEQLSKNTISQFV